MESCARRANASMSVAAPNRMIGEMTNMKTILSARFRPTSCILVILASLLCACDSSPPPDMSPQDVSSDCSDGNGPCVNCSDVISHCPLDVTSVCTDNYRGQSGVGAHQNETQEAIGTALRAGDVVVSVIETCFLAFHCHPVTAVAWGLATYALIP